SVPFLQTSPLLPMLFLQVFQLYQTPNASQHKPKHQSQQYQRPKMHVTTILVALTATPPLPARALALALPWLSPEPTRTPTTPRSSVSSTATPRGCTHSRTTGSWPSVPA